MGEVKAWLSMAGMVLGMAVLGVLSGIAIAVFYAAVVAIALRWYLLAIAGVFLLWKIAERL